MFNTYIKGVYYYSSNRLKLKWREKCFIKIQISKTSFNQLCPFIIVNKYKYPTGVSSNACEFWSEFFQGSDGFIKIQIALGFLWSNDTWWLLSFVLRMAPHPCFLRLVSIISEVRVTYLRALSPGTVAYLKALCLALFISLYGLHFYLFWVMGMGNASLSVDSVLWYGYHRMDITSLYRHKTVLYGHHDISHYLLEDELFCMGVMSYHITFWITQCFVTLYGNNRLDNTMFCKAIILGIASSLDIYLVAFVNIYSAAITTVAQAISEVVHWISEVGSLLYDLFL